MTRFEDITNWNKQNEIEISVKQKKEVKNNLIGKIKPHNNHKIWEINNDDLSIKEAKFSCVTVVMFGVKPNKEIIIKKNHSYVSALNKSNALKKYKKGMTGGKDIWDEPMRIY